MSRSSPDLDKKIRQQMLENKGLSDYILGRADKPKDTDAARELLGISKNASKLEIENTFKVFASEGTKNEFRAKLEKEGEFYDTSGWNARWAKTVESVIGTKEYLLKEATSQAVDSRVGTPTTPSSNGGTNSASQSSVTSPLSPQQQGIATFSSKKKTNTASSIAASGGGAPVSSEEVVVQSTKTSKDKKPQSPASPGKTKATGFGLEGLGTIDSEAKVEAGNIVDKTRNAVDEYKEKNHVGQSSNSSTLYTALTAALSGPEGRRSTLIQSDFAKYPLKEGKSAFASILAKHGLAEHIPALLINRVKAVVSEYEASQKGLMSIFKTHGDQSKELVSVLKAASKIENPTEAKTAIEAAFKTHANIGDRLGNLLKENGLDQFAKNCQPEQKQKAILHR